MEGGAVLAEDDLPAVELGHVLRWPEVQQGEDVDACRNIMKLFWT